MLIDLFIDNIFLCYCFYFLLIVQFCPNNKKKNRNNDDSIIIIITFTTIVMFSVVVSLTPRHSARQSVIAMAPGAATGQVSQWSPELVVVVVVEYLYSASRSASNALKGREGIKTGTTAYMIYKPYATHDNN